MRELWRSWEGPPRIFPGAGVRQGEWGVEALSPEEREPIRYSAVWTISHLGLWEEAGPSTQKGHNFTT